MKKVPLLFWVIYVVLLCVAFYFFIKHTIVADHKRIASLVPVTREMEVLPTEIRNTQNRGGITFNDSLVISSGCRVLEYPKGYKGWSTGFVCEIGLKKKGDWSSGIDVNFEEDPNSHILSDLPPPYTLWKKANNDTIYVRKDSLEFKFFFFSRR